MEEALETIRADQLYLACGCAHGDPAAIAAFDAVYVAAITPALAQMDQTGTLADEAKQLLRRRLLVAEGDALPRIADYAGRGDLRRWVRATAVRTALNLLRGKKKEVPFDEDSPLLAGIAEPDPELAHMKKLYRHELKVAFAEAVQAQPRRAQAVLRYHYVDGLNIDQIGAIFQVHRTTAFRWLERARSALVSQTRKTLQRHLGVQHSELESIMRLIQSRLDLTLRHYLARGEGEED